MYNRRFSRESRRLRFSYWVARLRAGWQSFADNWRVPRLVTNRWSVLGAYFLVVLLVSLAWFARSALGQTTALWRDDPSRMIAVYGRTEEWDAILADLDPELLSIGDWSESAALDSVEPPASASQPDDATPAAGSEDQSDSPVAAPPTNTAGETLPAAGQPEADDAMAESGAGGAEISLRYPLDGTVTISNSYAVIAHQTTMNDWRPHLAVDFAADPGSPVYAAAVGTVAQIISADQLWGTVVVLDHGNGDTTSYANLRDVAVHVGQSVNTRQLLGKLVGSPPAEQADPSHLHFVFTQGEDDVDPTALFR